MAKRQLLLAVVAIIVAVLAAGCHMSASDTSRSRAAKATATIGQPVKDGKFEFTVKSVDRSTTAGDPTNPYMRETAQGEFINVHLSVQNTGNEAQSYFASNQKLVVNGKQYDAASIIGVQGDMASLNPGLGIDETVVSFDVPKGSVPEAIILHDSAFSGGVAVKL